MEQKEQRLFSYETYEPNHFDLIICWDESIFLVTNGKWFGPTAYLFFGGTMYLKYQATSLEEVVRLIHKHHEIKDVKRGRWTVIKNIIKLQLGFSINW
ncbi:hypothetical protein [Anoxybacillus eryuanensis]|uniref:hypothetical protein n=1 Tax=Anoxybacillus eryuanensis TaxID=651866 RepID=UPI003EF23F63